MLPGILGRKIGMTHIFNDAGKMVPVTVVEAGPVYVTQLKNQETDGYTAIQVGYGDAPERKLTFPKFGHLKKAGLTKNLRTLRESSSRSKTKLRPNLRDSLSFSNTTACFTAVSRAA